MVKNIWKSYIWTADKDVNESDLRSNLHYLGSSENKAWKKFRPVRDLISHSVILWLFISRLVSFFLHPSFEHSTALNRHSDWCFLNHNWIINCNVIMIQSAETYKKLKKRETRLTVKQSVNWRFRIYEKKCEIYVWLVDNNDISKNGDKY